MHVHFLLVILCFLKLKTAYDLRISDWSSDVCSSDLAGERRWRAAQLAQLHEIPVLVREFDDRTAMEIALVENVQRRDLTALEEAEGYNRLIAEYDHSQEDIARAVGKSRSHVANTLRLLNLPPEVRTLLEDGQLTAGHARALLGHEQE